jgi:hypothetical protein
MFDVNWLAVLAGDIVFMVVGFVWYSVFGNRWAAYTGWTREKVAQQPQSQMAMSYGLTFVTALVTMFVLANILKLANAADIPSALLGAFFVWLGFTAAPTASSFIFEHRPWGLWLIEFGNTLVSLLIGAVILVLWK